MIKNIRGFISISVFILFMAGCSFFGELWQPSDILDRILNNSPQVSIHSPTNNQHVGSNYHILGGATGPGDGISTVYLRINNEAYQAVTLTETTWESDINLSQHGYYTNQAYGLTTSGESTATQSIVVLHIPIISVGPNQVVNTQASVTLSADIINDYGYAMSYQWQQLGSNSVTLSGDTTTNATFTTGTTSGILEFQFTLTSGGLEFTDTVKIAVGLQGPLADAGTDRIVAKGSAQQLQGEVTDPNGNGLTILWQQTSGTSVALSGSDTTNPGFTAPLYAGDLIFDFIVFDGVFSNVDSITVSVTNDVPDINAGTNLYY